MDEPGSTELVAVPPSQLTQSASTYTADFDAAQHASAPGGRELQAVVLHRPLHRVVEQGSEKEAGREHGVGQQRGPLALGSATNSRWN